MKTEITIAEPKSNLVAAKRAKAGSLGFIRDAAIDAYNGLVVLKTFDSLIDISDPERVWSHPIPSFNLLPAGSTVTLTVD
jgi:hypothetical protein